MMVVEHFVAGSHNHGPDPTSGGGTQLEFDAELEAGQSGRSERRASENMHGPAATQVIAPAKQKAIPFTIGLIIHGIADGCALGVSALKETSSQNSNGLSLIVFLALLLHKGETLPQHLTTPQCSHLELVYLLHISQYLPLWHLQSPF